MKSRKGRGPSNRKAGNSAPLRETVLEPAGEVEVVYRDVPSVPPEGKKIHRRRPLPLTPDAPNQDADDAN